MGKARATASLSPIQIAAAGRSLQYSPCMEPCLSSSSPPLPASWHRSGPWPPLPPQSPRGTSAPSRARPRASLRQRANVTDCSSVAPHRVVMELAALTRSSRSKSGLGLSSPLALPLASSPPKAPDGWPSWVRWGHSRLGCSRQRASARRAGARSCRRWRVRWRPGTPSSFRSTSSIFKAVDPNIWRMLEAFWCGSVADRLYIWRSSPFGRRTICRCGTAAATTRPTYSCSSDGGNQGLGCWLLSHCRAH